MPRRLQSPHVRTSEAESFHNYSSILEYEDGVMKKNAYSVEPRPDMLY